MDSTIYSRRVLERSLGARLAKAKQAERYWHYGGAEWQAVTQRMSALGLTPADFGLKVADKAASGAVHLVAA